MSEAKSQRANEIAKQVDSAVDRRLFFLINFCLRLFFVETKSANFFELHPVLAVCCRAEVLRLNTLARDSLNEHGFAEEATLPDAELLPRRSFVSFVWFVGSLGGYGSMRIIPFAL